MQDIMDTARNIVIFIGKLNSQQYDIQEALYPNTFINYSGVLTTLV